MNLDALFLSLGISAAITATQTALQHAMTKNDLPSRVDVSYPDPDPAFECHDVTVLGATTRQYVKGMEIINAHVDIRCDYCRTKHDYLTSNCRNCGWRASMILVLFILFSAFAALCGLLIYGYRSRAHSAEARANRAEGALGESRDYADKMRDIAALAIREAAQVAGIDPDEVLPRERTLQDVDPDMAEKYRRINADIAANAQANYIAQTVAFCPSCNVSVRHDPSEYPVKCPACKTLIDPVLDNPPELN